MPTVHFICGPPGAGKTTYAIALAQSIKGVRFTADEWLANLFAGDLPDAGPSALEWATERAARCEIEMWALAEQLIDLKMNVVFDVGLPQLDDRDRFRGRASQTR